MAKTRISDKYQVVIPKVIREQLGFKEGQRLEVYALDDGVLLTTQKRWPDDYIGTQKKIWDKIDVVNYLRQERNSWDQDG